MAHKILIVDDEIGLCRMIAKVLRSANYECIIAHSGEEALDAYRATTPDLILLDIAMPGITGWDVAQAIRAQEREAQEVGAAQDADRITGGRQKPPTPKMPIVIMSAHSRLFDLAEELNLSIESFLIKPLDLAQVVTLVTDILKNQAQPS